MMNILAAAKYLGVHQVVVRGMITGGLLKLNKQGTNHRLISKATLDAIIEASDRSKLEFDE